MKQETLNTVMAFGTFDILHNGHENFFKQAREYGDYLIVVIARDKTVEQVKGKLPRNNETARLKAVRASGLADEAVLGSLTDKYAAIKKYKPDVVCLGYDQQVFTDNLKNKLAEYKLNAKIVRLKPYHPDKYKSSFINMNNNIENLMKQWLKTDDPNDYGDYYCETRDVFQARLEKMKNILSNNNKTSSSAPLISAIAGEIGNNSFDHNMGNWPDIMGIFFGFIISDNDCKIVLADRGLGILKTLQRVIPGLERDTEALETAFTKIITSRFPEKRGNGLKFVKNSIMEKQYKLKFISGNAQITINHDLKSEEISEFIGGCLAIISFNI